MAAATSRRPSSSAWQRGHVARCPSRSASSSSPSTASRAYAPRSSLACSWEIMRPPPARRRRCQRLLAGGPPHPGADAALDRALGLVQQPRDLPVGATVEVRQLYGPAFLVGELPHRVRDLVGHGEVPHLVLHVVGRRCAVRAASRASPPPARAGRGAGRHRRPGRAPAPAGTSAGTPGRGRSGRARARDGGRLPGSRPRPRWRRSGPAWPDRRRPGRGGGRPRPGPPRYSERWRSAQAGRRWLHRCGTSLTCSDRAPGSSDVDPNFGSSGRSRCSG